MSKINISKFLLSSKEHKHARSAFREASHACVNSCKLTILSKLGSSEIKILKPFDPKKDMVILNILKDKSKKIKTSRSPESSQVDQIEKSLSKISSQIETQRKMKKKGHWIKPIEDVITEENSEHVKKIMHEQVERIKKVSEALEKEKKARLETLDKLQQQETIEKAKRAEEEKQKKINESKERAEERKKYLEGLKELKNVKKQKWLHEKLAEEFENNYLKPESERIAEVLAIRHKEPVPTIEDIQSHIREYKRIQESRTPIRQSAECLDIKKFPHSKFLKSLLEEEQLSKELEKIKEAEKNDLLDRKKNYSKLVRQLYQPSFRNLSSRPKETLKKNRRNLSVTPTLKQSESLPRKIPSPKAKKPKELPKINYLEQHRQISEKDAKNILGRYYNSLDISSLDQAKKAEEKFKRVEIAMKGLRAGEVNLEAEEKLNKVLLDSIKVKLSALNKQ